MRCVSGMDVRLVTAEGVQEHPVEELAEMLDREDGLVWVDIPTCDEEAVGVLSEVFELPPDRPSPCTPCWSARRKPRRSGNSLRPATPRTRRSRRSPHGRPSFAPDPHRDRQRHELHDALPRRSSASNSARFGSQGRLRSGDGGHHVQHGRRSTPPSVGRDHTVCLEFPTSLPAGGRIVSARRLLVWLGRNTRSTVQLRDPLAVPGAHDHRVTEVEARRRYGTVHSRARPA